MQPYELDPKVVAAQKAFTASQDEHQKAVDETEAWIAQQSHGLKGAKFVVFRNELMADPPKELAAMLQHTADLACVSHDKRMSLEAATRAALTDEQRRDHPEQESDARDWQQRRDEAKRLGAKAMARIHERRKAEKAG